MNNFTIIMSKSPQIVFVLVYTLVHAYMHIGLHIHCTLISVLKMERTPVHVPLRHLVYFGKCCTGFISELYSRGKIDYMYDITVSTFYLVLYSI